MVFFELKRDFFFNFSNPHLTKYLNLNTQNQPLMRDDETSTITSDEANTIWAEVNKNSLSYKLLHLPLNLLIQSEVGHWIKKTM